MAMKKQSCVHSVYKKIYNNIVLNIQYVNKINVYHNKNLEQNNSK